MNMRLIIEVFTILILTILLIGCSTKTETKIQTYGIITELNKNEIAVIDLDKYDSFINLVNRIEKIVCNDSIPTISVNDENTEKWIGLANSCWEGVACILIKRRNVLKIQDERIEMNKTVNLDSLGVFISKHFTNEGESYLFSENPKKAKIAITYKDLPISGLKMLLWKIIESYEIQNLETPLILTLDRLIPLPPPSTISVEHESSEK